MDIVEDALLIHILSEDAVEDEQFAAVGGVDGNLLGGGDLDARDLEALRDELEARVAVLERRAHADGCVGRGLAGGFTFSVRGRGGKRDWMERGKVHCTADVPTLTAVLESSSEAREPPCLLLMLILLEERFGRIIALMGRCIAPGGEPGGEAIRAWHAAVPSMLRYAVVRSMGAVCRGASSRDFEGYSGGGRLGLDAAHRWVRRAARRWFYLGCLRRRGGPLQRATGEGGGGRAEVKVKGCRRRCKCKCRCAEAAGSTACVAKIRRADEDRVRVCVSKVSRVGR